MLSAVAARKARLAQAQTQAPAETQTSAAIPSPEPESKKAARSKPSSSQKPPSKRKPSASAGNPPKKKKAQHRKDPSNQHARYFAQEDAFTTQNDVILVDDSEDESSAASSSAATDDDDARSRPLRAGAARPGGKRAWSPSAPLPDSSDEDGGEGDELVLLDAPVSHRQPASDESRILSTFKPVLDQNVFHLPAAGDSAQKRTVLLLKASDTVAFLGAYSLTVLHGAITLAGVPLSVSSTAHPVYAPRSAPLPVIICLPYSPSDSGSAPRVKLPGHVADAASACDAVVLLQALCTGVEGLGRICRTFDGFFAPSRWQRDQARFDFGLENVYFLPLQTPDTSPLVIPPTWTAATDDVLPADEEDARTRRRVFMVKGPRNAGKSTLARLLLNKLLSRFRRVAYLECDLGQSEFTPGGMVSLNVVEQPLFGPTFTHPSIPFAAHFTGATSPKTSPSHYLDSIQALVQQYEIDVRNAVLDEDGVEEDDGRTGSSIPLVVNTMGWTRGLGADLARKVEAIVEPSDIFAFSSSDDEQAYAAPSGVQSYSTGAPRIHVVETVAPLPTTSHYTAADQRNLSILSYFHAVFPQEPHPPPYSSPVAVAWNTSLPLCAQPPYEVDWQAAFEKLVLTGAGSEDVVPSELHRALNCAVVGIVACEPGTLEVQSPLDDSGPGPFHYEQGATPPIPNTSRCVGLGLVRAISPPPKTHVQLLTPVPTHLLASARVLVKGELQLPVWGMLDFRTLDDGGDIAGYERGKVPYLRWGKGEGAGGERRRVRRNLMRKGQM
ncbi:hypothetical protein BV20DRAFT_665380 [Pilatotrama ljubarskyi]|nr:hypothetical protein BV20DRAFT_665380 [Pilatotrama ljubarskyi]